MRWVSSVVRVMWQGSCGAVIAVGQRGEEFGLGIAVLDLEPLPVDRRAVEARRRPGLEPREGEPGRVETARKRHRGLIAEAPGRRALVAEMDHSAKERAGGQDDRAAADCAAVGELDPR